MINASHQVLGLRVFRLSLFVLALMVPTTGGYASSSSRPAETVHLCRPLDLEEMRALDSTYAASKHTLNLNVGPPRSVRMIYFLPNGRPYRASVVDSMKRTIRQIQTFYGELMQANGYGFRTFGIETDASGEPIVHRVDGQRSVNQYSDDTLQQVYKEIGHVFDFTANIYFLVIDNGLNTVGSRGREFSGLGAPLGKGGGIGLVSGNFDFVIAAHEIGHAFGLRHDFNDDANIMSYGSIRTRLSACSAGLLAINPYFNAGVGTAQGRGPTVELISETRYPAGSRSVRIRTRVRDSNGLHMVIFFVPTREPHLAAGSIEVKACRKLDGEHESLIEFDYNGVIPSKIGSGLFDPDVHPIIVEAYDTAGDGGQTREANGVGWASFTLSKIPPENVPLLTFENYGGGLVSFSPDGAMLAGGSSFYVKDEVVSSSVNLWSTEETLGEIPPAQGDYSRRPIDRLGGNNWTVSSVAFSPDGTLLAAGRNNHSSSIGIIELWEVARSTPVRRLAASLDGPSDFVGPVMFSPDGRILAGGGASQIRLWDVARREKIDDLPGYGGISVAFSPDGKTLASAVVGGVQLWDVVTQAHIAVLRGLRRDMIPFIAFSPDSSTLASTWGSDGVQLSNVNTRAQIAVLKGGNGEEFSSVAFSPTGKTLASGSWDFPSKVVLWEVATRQTIATFVDGHDGISIGSVKFSPDGRILASGSGSAGTIHLWDLSSLGVGVPAPTFSITLDVDAAAGNQGVKTIGVAPGSVVPIQLFGNNVQGANGISAKFVYDADQVGYEGFRPGGVLPNAKVLAVPSTNPTAIDINVVSFGGQATTDSGMVGSVRFRTTVDFSGTTLRLVRAQIGRGDQHESITPTDIAVTLRLAQPSPDFNGDGRVDFGDFVALGMHFGLSRGDARYSAKYDLDQDGTIGFGDFLIFGRKFGT